MQEYDYEKRIMGCEGSISLIAPNKIIADREAARLFALAEIEEERFSRFRDTSELSLLNQNRSLTVSADFMDAFRMSRELYRSSGGVFNPLVDISRFGYDADIEEVKGKNRKAAGSALPYSIDMETIVVDDSASIIVLQEGQHLDFGGFLKGHVAEKMAKSVQGCAGVVVNLGGDIFSLGLNTEGKPFVFSIDHPLDEWADLSFFVSGKAIATSGSYNRHWKLEGTPFFHILDASGKKNPVSDIVSATVIARTGREADAFATVALILGVDRGARILEENYLEYCFIRSDGSIDASIGFPMTTDTETYQYA